MYLETSVRPRIIVLTPIKNERWILQTFLSATSLWADYIILSDQNSSDASLEIVSKYSKAIVLANSSEIYNEAENRKSLLAEARRLFGTKNILFSLDADEVISPEILTPNIQEKIRKLKPGTAIRFQLANVSKDRVSYWPARMAPTAFVDDGRDPNFEGEIHFPRTCFSNFREIFETDLAVIHLQYLSPKRTERKHVWYQMWEFINSPNMGPVEIYRRYHHQASVNPKNIRLLPESWRNEYKKEGIDIFNFEDSNNFWWDEQIGNWVSQSGLRKFRQLDIDSYFHEVRDVRSALDSFVLGYLAKTQRQYRPGYLNPIFICIYFIDRLLGLIWKR